MRKEPASPSGKGRRVIRLRDIADLAGVHVTTVSSVLSPRSRSGTRVSEATARRIRELAKQLDYRPDVHARIMRKQRTNTIALLEFGYSEIHLQRTIDLAKAVRREGYQPLIVNLLWYMERGEEEGMKAAFDHVLDSRPEGIILITPSVNLPLQQVSRIQEMGVPCVSFNGVYFAGLPQVRSDAAAGAEALTRHLLNLGRKRLALVVSWGTNAKDENTCWPTLERIVGFRAAILAAGGCVVEGKEALWRTPEATAPVGALVIADIPKPFWEDSMVGYELAHEVLAAADPARRPDALVCSNDQYAIGAIRACFELEINVPEAVALVGFGGEKGTKFLCPSLTTVDTLAPANANFTVDLLLKMIRKERPLSEGGVMKMPCDLTIRESCGAQHSRTRLNAVC